MNNLLAPYGKFHIFIVEQSDDGEKFNIGKLKNIGFEQAQLYEKKNNIIFDNYVFSDVDMIPNYELVPYYFQTFDSPTALAIRGTRYQVFEGGFLGGVCAFTKTDFKKVNGYPNSYYGWGNEENSLLIRMVLNNLSLYYPKVGSVIDIEENNNHSQVTLNEKFKLLKNKKNNLQTEKMMNDLTTWQQNGLSNLNYDIKRTRTINNNTTQIKVDLKKKEDEKLYPNLYELPVINNKNYNKMKKKSREHIKQIKIKYV